MYGIAELLFLGGNSLLALALVAWLRREEIL
jgi:hypothetical protein